MASFTYPRSGVDSFPAPAQIAFALVVLKSKPAEASVEDYLNKLRRCIVDGCAPVQRQTSQHLDGAGYWKTAYDKAEEEKAALLDKLYELEKQKATAALLSSPAARSPLTRDGKRRQEETPAKANSRSKRRVNPSKTPQSPAKDDSSGERGEALLASEVSYGATKLLQTFFTLRIHLETQPSTVSTIQASAKRLGHTISTTITSVTSATKPNISRSGRHADTWLAIRRTYPTLLEAMQLLYESSQKHIGAEALISELSKILDKLLKCLQPAAIREQRTKTHSYDGDDQIQVLTNLIAGMMTDLDLTKEAHRELFDALLCTFFEHLGLILSLAVFSDPRIQDLRQPPGLSLPQGLLDGPDVQTDLDFPAALDVAPYLITILRKIKPRMDQRGKIDSDGCAGAVVDKMQNTLLRGLFGDQDQTFWNSLRRPAEAESSDDIEDVAAVSEVDVTSEWFIGEIWNNVGWNILTKHIN